MKRYTVVITGILDRFVAEGIVDMLRRTGLPQSMSIEIREVEDEEDKDEE